jgi:hypothetical protein
VATTRSDGHAACSRDDPMKKTNRNKLTLDRATVRSLSDKQLLAPDGGYPNVSVGTCSGCRWTYCATDVTCVASCV